MTYQGGISGADIYGSGGAVSGTKPSQLVEGSGVDASVIGGHPAKWWIGLVAILVALRLLYERAK